MKYRRVKIIPYIFLKRILNKITITTNEISIKKLYLH